jgi:hypothetical protein
MHASTRFDQSHLATEYRSLPYLALRRLRYLEQLLTVASPQRCSSDSSRAIPVLSSSFGSSGAVETRSEGRLIVAAAGSSRSVREKCKATAGQPSNAWVASMWRGSGMATPISGVAGANIHCGKPGGHQEPRAIVDER